ncbi:Undecaprenyl phosphate-alpha-4-amino-4-deoxy-L-arabinose arabinosyl transferase [bioreactor metagenome]|uniref:Undecaprenyl phosphate-alpha-4-amino-4-deoxy-L-arabinose arabinosyl transferase n=1 Tax=bioreactor metagenome TaxID=1076179 RepID=A0A644T0T6_9ZZZZ
MQRSATFILIAVIASIIMFYNLGGIPLLDPDEPVYAETPKEMFAFQDFTSPRIYGEYWYDKPPMYYWLVAASYKVFGVSEFAARFPSALLGVVGVLVVYSFSRRLFNERAALASALVLATSIEYFYLSKAAVTDITLNLFLTLSLLSFITKKYYWFYLWAGLATLTKGPIGLLFPTAIIFLYLVTTWRFSELKSMKIPAGIMIYALVGIPWYLMMYQIHGSIFIDTFLGFHNITRFTSPEHPEVVLWYYYIPVLILGFFPWTAIGIQAVWSSIAKSRSERDTLIFLNIWAFFILLFFTVSQTKLVSYILPMFPPLAMIVGWYLNFLWQGRKQHCLSWPIALVVLSCLFIAAMIIGLKAMPDLKLGVIIMSVILAIAAFAVFYLIYRQQFYSAFWMQVIAMMMFSIVLMSFLFPVASPNFTTVHIAKEFTEKYDGASPVYIIKFLRPGFAFYTDFYGKELLNADQFSKTIVESKRAYFVVRELDYNRLSDVERQQVKIVAKIADKMLLLKQ